MLHIHVSAEPAITKITENMHEKSLYMLLKGIKFGITCGWPSLFSADIGRIL
jgi:hypothetical protein